MLARLVVVLPLVAAGPLAAQTLPPQPHPVAMLPGAGRAVDTAAYRARRDRLGALVAPAVVVVPAAQRRSLEREVLQDRDFRQDDYFFYLTGIETPGAWLVMVAPEDGPIRTTLWLPRVSPRASRWTGVALAAGGDAARLTGIAAVRHLDPDSLGIAVAAAAREVEAPVFATRPSDPRYERVVAGADVAAIRDVGPALDRLRLVKDEVGLAALRRAIDITVAGIVEGMRRTEPGMTEYQLEAVVEYTFRRLGADRLGFPSIVGSGPHSVTLHYDVNRRRMESGDLVVVDVGAEYAQHTGDVTRTFPVSGRFTERQHAVYDLVLAAQDALIAAVRPGVTVRELNAVARQYLVTHSGGVCGASDCSRYLAHGVSHWLGMRVHDVGDYRTPLTPGMVLTVEPGIYLDDEQLGVRIEDVVLVTTDGAEVLSRGAPRTAAAIEHLMASAAARN